MTQVLNSGIYFTFSLAMVTINGRQNKLEIEKSFWSKFKAFQTDFLRIRYQRKKNIN